MVKEKAILSTLWWNLLSVSGRLEVMEELVDVRVVTDGGRRGNVSPKTNITSEVS